MGGLWKDEATASGRRRGAKRLAKQRFKKVIISPGELKARLPAKLNGAGLNSVGLSVLRDFVLGTGDFVPFVFFEEAFPPNWQENILISVRKIAKIAVYGGQW